MSVARSIKERIKAVDDDDEAGRAADVVSREGLRRELIERLRRSN